MTLEQISMQLVLAVKTENLEKTKELVQSINELDPKVDEIYYILSIFSIDYQSRVSFVKALYNPCIDYIISNLMNLPIAERILFFRERERMFNTTDPEQIEAYIQEYLNKEQYPVENKIIIQSLIKLVASLQDNTKISYYFSLINKKFLL